MLVVIFGGVMPSTIYFVDVVNDASVLSVVRDGAGFLSVFNEPQRAALAMFPDKELAYNIIYKPRLQRLMRERYRIQ